MASFISTPIMRGFFEGLVYVTIIGQVPHLLGTSGASGKFFHETLECLTAFTGRFGRVGANRHSQPDSHAVASLSGASVIAAMLHLTKPRYLLDLFTRNRWAFANAVIVIAGELTLGVLQGIALGVVLSLLMLIYLTSHPQGAVLGRLPETEAYRDVQLHPEAITFPGLLIWRIGGDAFFASIGYVCAALKASLAARPDVKRVLLHFAPDNHIDVSSGDALLSLIKELQDRGISLAFARVRDAVRRGMRLAGIEAVVGPSNFHERKRMGCALGSNPVPRPVH